MSLYRELELLPNATADEIKKFYHKLSLQYHPDKNVDGATKFVELKRSYDILSNKDLRVIYNYEKLDQYLAMKNTFLETNTDDLINYFSVFPNQISSDYNKPELISDFTKKDFDKIVARLMVAYNQKDPVFSRYHDRMLKISFSIIVVSKIWNFTKICFKYFCLGLSLYYVGYRRILF